MFSKIHSKYFPIMGVICIGSILLALFKFSFSFQALIGSLFLGTLTLLAFIDIAIYEVPNRLILFIFILGILNFCFVKNISVISALIGFFVVSVPFLIITLLTGGIGGGDIKLVAACGFLMGTSYILLGVFLAVIIAGVWGGILLITHLKSTKDHLPFVPFLAVGLATSYLFGDVIINWYISLLHF